MAMDINITLYGLIPGVIGVIPFLVQRWDVGRALDEALAESVVTRKAAADAMGISIAQLSREISGCGPEHLSAHRMTRLPNRIWWRLLPKLAAGCDISLPTADSRARQFAQVVTQTVRVEVRRDRREGVYAQLA